MWWTLPHWVRSKPTWNRRTLSLNPFQPELSGFASPIRCTVLWHPIKPGTVLNYIVQTPSLDAVPTRERAMNAHYENSMWARTHRGLAARSSVPKNGNLAPDSVPGWAEGLIRKSMLLPTPR